MNPYKRHGAFSWTELLTTEPEAAANYYSSVFRWDFSEMDMGEQGTYHVASVDDKPVGGIMKRPDENIPVHWGVYITVDDVDETVEEIKAGGGRALIEPFDAEGVGRMCPVADPQGAVFNVIAYEDTDQDMYHRVVAEAFTTHGAFSWFELYVPDAKAAESFYGDLFGWTVKWQDMPTGPYGEIKIGDVSIAGMMSMSSDQVPPSWGVYVTVDDYDAHAERVADAGGKTVMEPMTVPNVGTFAVSADPQGGMLSGIEYAPMPETEAS